MLEIAGACVCVWCVVLGVFVDEAIGLQLWWRSLRAYKGSLRNVLVLWHTPSVPSHERRQEGIYGKDQPYTTTSYASITNYAYPGTTGRLLLCL